MAWQKFTETNQRFEDKITVTTSNSFGFSGKFYKDQGLNNFRYAVLYYDPEKNAVGFSFSNDDAEKHKFSIVTGKNAAGGQISARSFFKSNNLEAKDYQGKYDWSVENDQTVGKLYVIMLKKKTAQEENATQVIDPGVPPATHSDPTAPLPNPIQSLSPLPSPSSNETPEENTSENNSDPEQGGIPEQSTG